MSRPSVPRALRATGFACALALLAACGTARESPFATVLRTAAAGVGKAGQGGSDPVESQLNRAALDAAPGPLLLAELPARKARATLVEAGRNRAHISWIGADGVGLVLREGVLTRTHGLGQDLVSVDSAAAEAALRRGSGSATRVHRYLDGENRIYARSFDCSYATVGRPTIEIVERAFATREVAETCQGEAGRFANRYWIGADGFVWRSQQWIGPEVGSVVLTRLVR